MKGDQRNYVQSDVAHGNRGGGALHNVATAEFAGFMSAADKEFVDRENSVPVTKSTNFAVASGDRWLTCDRAATTTVILPPAASNGGRTIDIRTVQAQAVVSSSPNVVPITGGAAGTAILPATGGAWATLVSDGASWVVVRRG